MFATVNIFRAGHIDVKSMVECSDVSFDMAVAQEEKCFCYFPAYLNIISD